MAPKIKTKIIRAIFLGRLYGNNIENIKIDDVSIIKSRFKIGFYTYCAIPASKAFLSLFSTPNNAS